MSDNSNPETAVDPGEVARSFVQEVVDAMGLAAEARAEQGEDGTWRVEVVGDDAGELVGRYGEIIDGLQYLTTLVTLRRTGEHTRLQLDAGGYRAKREAALTKRARELAAEVVEAGQEAELDPLSSFERRIIHNALMDFPGVRTYSEGEGDERRVIIAPAE